MSNQTTFPYHSPSKGGVQRLIRKLRKENLVLAVLNHDFDGRGYCEEYKRGVYIFSFEPYETFPNRAPTFKGVPAQKGEVPENTAHFILEHGNCDEIIYATNCAHVLRWETS